MELATRETSVDRKLQSDLKTLALFIDLYCRHKHADLPRNSVVLRTHDVKRIAGRDISLCENCTRLLTHAFTKRSHCPLEPKPACKHCPSQCYHAKYRETIRQVMRYSGRKMLLGGRLDYLFHLIF